MIRQVLLGSGLTLVTTVVHAGAMVLALRTLRPAVLGRREAESAFSKATPVAFLVLLMVLASLVESAIWAATYLTLGAFRSFEPALYFSTVTFTTFGYGDLVMNEKWRLVASFQAVNGIIMFGWTAALIVAVVQRLYFGAPRRRAARAHPRGHEGTSFVICVLTCTRGYRGTAA
jgi:hypothetical protein